MRLSLQKDLSDPANGHMAVHPNINFNISLGEDGVAVEDGDADQISSDWQDANDSWKAIVVTHQPGYFAQGLSIAFNTIQPDGIRYFVSPYAPRPRNSPYSHGSLSQSASFEWTGLRWIHRYARSIGSDTITGTPTCGLSFTKTSLVPSAPNQQPTRSFLHARRKTIGPMGSTDKCSDTPCELGLRVYWPGNVNATWTIRC